MQDTHHAQAHLGLRVVLGERALHAVSHAGGNVQQVVRELQRHTAEAVTRHVRRHARRLPASRFWWGRWWLWWFCC
jgi:hypothetical protein